MSTAEPPNKKPRKSGIIYAKSGFGKKLIVVLENCVLEFGKVCLFTGFKISLIDL